MKLSRIKCMQAEVDKMPAKWISVCYNKSYH